MSVSVRSARSLVGELEAAGWGTLAPREFHGVKVVLQTLVRYSYADRVIVATANQVADRAAHSPRHVRRCLHLLEDMGVIVWTRGHIEAGRPRPGWFRVKRSALAQLVAHARDMAKERRARRALETRHRIQTTVRNSTLWTRKRHKPLSVHADMASTLPLRGGKGGAPNAAPPPSDTEETMKQACIHAHPDINSCGMCRMALRQDPTLDVRTLWATGEERSEDPHGWAERARAAIRQAKHAQGTLS